MQKKSPKYSQEMWVFGTLYITKGERIFAHKEGLQLIPVQVQLHPKFQ